MNVIYGENESGRGLPFIRLSEPCFWVGTRGRGRAAAQDAFSDMNRGENPNLLLGGNEI